MIQSGMATSSIFDYGSDYLKQEYLVPAIKGNKIAAFALSEPNAGSDVASIECKAVEDGDSYVIGGNKTYISNGPIADFVLTAAYTDKSKGSNGGISLFVVDTKFPGFSARKMHKFCQQDIFLSSFRNISKNRNFKRCLEVFVSNTCHCILIPCTDT